MIGCELGPRVRVELADFGLSGERRLWLAERLSVGVDQRRCVAAHVTSLEGCLSIVACGHLKPGQPVFTGFAGGEPMFKPCVRFVVFCDSLPEDLQNVLPDTWRAGNRAGWNFLRDYGASRGMWAYFDTLQEMLDIQEVEAVDLVSGVSDLEEARSLCQRIAAGRFGLSERARELALFHLGRAMRRRGVVFLWDDAILRAHRASVVPDDELEGAVCVLTDSDFPIDKVVSVVPLGRFERKALEKVCGGATYVGGRGVKSSYARASRS